MWINASQERTMSKSECKTSACRALADTTTTIITPSNVESDTESSSKMSLCRACLVLLGSQDTAYDLCRERDLAAKFFSCMATRDDDELLWRTQHEEDLSSKIVLHCICECCYQLVQKFHDFQCMCEESVRNFDNILLEINAELNDSKDREGKDRRSEVKEKQKKMETVIQIPTESIEEIEEVYIMEDETTKETLDKEKIPTSGLTHRVGNKMDCQICGRGFYKMALYEAHMQKHRGEEPYKCTVASCDKSYSRSNSLTTHLKEAHQNCITKYPCVEPNCNKIYTAMRSLNYHIRRQHSKGENPLSSPHVCEKCGKSYGRRAHLTRHQWVHRSKGECKYTCNHCSQRFYTDQNLKDHILRRHSPHKQSYRCRRCGRIFESPIVLSNHMKIKHAKFRSKIKG